MLRSNDYFSNKGTRACCDKVTTLKKGLCKQQPTPEKMMLKEDGSKCKNSEENSEVFRKHFKNLYERTPVYDQEGVKLLPNEPIVDGLDHLPTNDEILKAKYEKKYEKQSTWRVRTNSSNV